MLYPEKSVTFHINHITEVTQVSLLSVISSIDCPLTSGMQPCQGIQSPADIFCDKHFENDSDSENWEHLATCL